MVYDATSAHISAALERWGIALPEDTATRGARHAVPASLREGVSGGGQGAVAVHRHDPKWQEPRQKNWQLLRPLAVNWSFEWPCLASLPGGGMLGCGGGAAPYICCP